MCEVADMKKFEEHLVKMFDRDAKSFVTKAEKAKAEEKKEKDEQEEDEQDDDEVQVRLIICTYWEIRMIMK